MLPTVRPSMALRSIMLSCALVFGLLLGTPVTAQAATKAPSGLSVRSYSNNAVRLSWKPAKKAAGYQVKYSSSSKLKHASYLKVAGTVAEIGGLKASRKYYFKVRALKADGTALTKYGKTKKVKTRSKKSYSTLSPAGLAAVANYGDELTLSWAPQGTTNRYLLRWATKKSMKKAKSRTVTGTTTILEGLERGTPYYLTVEVRSAKNKSLSQRTSVVKITTAKLISFGTPTGVAVSRVNPTDLTVSWNPVRKAPQYRVAYAAGTWAETDYVTTASLSIKAAGLIANTDYLVKVQAVDAAGQPAGEFSTAVPVKTPAQDAGLRLASYNVMCDTHTCSSKSAEAAQPWTVRRDYVVNTINQADPDVVSLQEARQSKLDGSEVVQFNDLVGLLKSPWALTNTNRYNCSNPNSNACLNPDGTKKDANYTDQGAADDVRIAYRTDRIKLLKDSNGATRQGSVRLPATPIDNPGWIDPSPRPRYMAWAFLQQRSTGKKFLMIDVHLEPRNDSDISPDSGCGTSANPICGKIRLAQAQRVAQEIARLNTEGLPVVMAGDVSSSRAEPGTNLPYTALIGSGLVDPLRPVTDSGTQYYTAAAGAPAETRTNIAFNSVNQYERAARCYNCRVDGVFDATRVNSYNGAYNDYILTSPMRISEFEQVVNVDSLGNFIGVIPSDHNLIRATLWLP